MSLQPQTSRTDEHVELMEGRTVYSWREGRYFYAEFNGGNGKTWRAQADSERDLAESLQAMFEFQERALS